MIHIKKGEEPQALKVYRESDDINKSYENFRDKDIVREFLLKEQGFLCAYCTRAIGYEPSKWYKEVRIEHYRCRHEFDTIQLDYNNMLAVCTCSQGLKEQEQHCDVSKGKQFIHIDPKNQEHVNTLKYSEGGVLSTNSQFAEDIEKTLGLNHSTLPINRRETLNNVILQMKRQKDKGIDIKEILSKTLHLYNSSDVDLRKKPFCGIVIAYCSKLISKI